MQFKSIKKYNIYALYKGDTFLDIGTVRDLAIKYNIELKTIKYYSSKAYLKKCKNSDNRLIAVNIDKIVY